MNTKLVFALTGLNIGLLALFLISLGSDVWEFYLTLMLAGVALQTWLMLRRR